MGPPEDLRMRSFFIIATAACFCLGSALAQPQNPPAQSGPSNPAVKTTEGNNANAPVAGANSFTEGQAKSRIEAQGFSSVSTLTKDKDGVWRGKAVKGGRQMDVSVDFQGNVVAKGPGA
jgi:hypothetical protein